MKKRKFEESLLKSKRGTLGLMDVIKRNKKWRYKQREIPDDIIDKMEEIDKELYSAQGKKKEQLNREYAQIIEKYFPPIPYPKKIWTKESLRAYELNSTNQWMNRILELDEKIPLSPPEERKRLEKEQKEILWGQFGDDRKIRQREDAEDYAKVLFRYLKTKFPESHLKLETYGKYKTLWNREGINSYEITDAPAYVIRKLGKSPKRMVSIFTGMGDEETYIAGKNEEEKRKILNAINDVAPMITGRDYKMDTKILEESKLRHPYQWILPSIVEKKYKEKEEF